MPRDAQQIEDTRAWLTKAALDLRAGEGDLVLEPPIPEDAMFHAQQAAEKVLKAFLAWYDEPFRKTHDLRELGRQCVRIDPALDTACSKAEALTPFAWQFRYPEEPSAPSVQEAKEALALAREVYETILGRLPEEVRP